MKKISRTIQRRLAVLLSVVIAICSTPTVAHAQLAEDQPIAEVQTEENNVLLGEPDGSSTAHTLTLVGVAGITSASIGDLESLGFTIDGNTATLSFTDDDESFELPTIMKDNCEFYGWYITGESPSTAEIYVDFSTSIGEDVSYTAKFVGSYTVTFKDGETTFPTLGFSYLTGQATIVLPEVPNKTGYTGNGWVLEGGSDVFSAGATSLADIGIGTTIQEGNLVFNASYTPIDYTITLTGLEGISVNSISAIKNLGFTVSGNKATISKTIEDSLTIPAISRSHRDFSGWQKGTNEPTQTVILAVGDITSNLSYTAVFTVVKTLTVNFNLEGGAFQAADIEGWSTFGYAAGTNESLLAYSDDNLAAIKNIPTPVKEDYVFTGWNTGTGTDRPMSYTLPTPNDQVLNLTATWIQGTEGETIIETEGNAVVSVSADSINAIKNILDDNVGTGATSVTKIIIVGSAAETYAGTGIEDELNAAFSGVTVNVTKTYVDIDITQYITSSENSTANEIHDLGQVVDITYQPTGGVANLKAIVREHGVAPNVTYTRFKELTAAPTTLEDGTYFIDGEVVHIYTRYFSTYAFGYASGVYKVSFDTNGGNETYEPIYTDKLGTLPTPTKSGYWSFQKWTYPNGNTAATNDIVSAETVLTAVWEDTTPPGPGPTSLIVSFDANGGSAVEPITVTDGRLPTLPDSIRANYILEGWFYQDGTEAMAGDEITSNITLIAKWWAASAGEITSISLNMIEFRLYQKQTFTLKATVNPEDVPDKSVIWTSSNANIATVSAGKVEAVDVGTCIIVATSTIDETKFAICEVTVLKSDIVDTDDEGRIINPGSKAIDEKTGQANVWIGGLNLNGYYFTGKAIKPTIHVYKGYQLLREGVDYTLSYKNNTKVTTSTAENKQPKITIKMKARHSGSEEVYFKILPMPLDQLAAQDPTLCVPPKSKKAKLTPVLTYQDTAVKYSSKDVSFKWFATDAAGNALDISSDCDRPGLYAVKIFAGQSGNLVADANGYQVATVLVSDKVLFDKVKIGNFKSSLPYNDGIAVVQAAKLSYKSSVLVENTDYTVTYKNNYDIGTATVTYEAIKDAAGNYTGNFAGKVVKTFKIKGKYVLDADTGSNVEITLAEDSYPFNNANIKPAVTVTATVINNAGKTETRTLVQGKDYTVSYKNNKAVASQDAESSTGKDIAPQVIIKGKGNYRFGAKNSAVVRFNITEADLSSLVLTVYDKAYSKKADAYKSTKIVFSDDTYRDLKLKAGKDYTATYTATYTTSDGSDVPAVGQTVDITITAEENSPYIGTVTSTYRILDSKADVNKAKVVVNPNSKGKTSACIYTGTDIEPGQADQPALVVTMGSGKNLEELVQGIDYEIVGYYNNVAPSKKAIVVVRGIGSYYGVKVVKFTISTKPVSTCWGGIYGQLD